MMSQGKVPSQLGSSLLVDPDWPCHILSTSTAYSSHVAKNLARLQSWYFCYTWLSPSADLLSHRNGKIWHPQLGSVFGPLWWRNSKISPKGIYIWIEQLRKRKQSLVVWSDKDRINSISEHSKKEITQAKTFSQDNFAPQHSILEQEADKNKQ